MSSSSQSHEHRSSLVTLGETGLEKYHGGLSTPSMDKHSPLVNEMSNLHKLVGYLSQMKESIIFLGIRTRSDEGQVVFFVETLRLVVFLLLIIS
jgi:hypothetical protein